jgi:hypothetical protein
MASKRSRFVHPTTPFTDGAQRLMESPLLTAAGRTSIAR